MRRSFFLKYISIFMILTSLARFFFGFMMINFFATAKTFGAVEPEMMRRALLALLLVLICAGAEMVCGFQGALNWAEPLLAGRCVRWGVAAVLSGLAGNGLQWLTGYGVSFVAWTTGVVMPGAYLLAAVLFFRRSKGGSG